MRSSNVSLSALAVIAAMVLLVCPSRAEQAGPGAARPQAPSEGTALTSVHQWVVSQMLAWSPPGRTYVKDAKETPDDGKARYEEIANAAIMVAYDPSEAPLFKGKYGRAMTLAVMMSVSWFESGYRKDVDLGVGPLARGDNGKSWCLAQVMMGTPGPGGKTVTRIDASGSSYRFFSDRTFSSGWGGEDLVQDRMKCYRVGLRIARRSFSACRHLPLEERLASYAAGKCGSEAGKAKSRARVTVAQRWLARSRPPHKDSEVMQILYPEPPAAGPADEPAEKSKEMALLSPGEIARGLPAW